ncbi:MAG: phage head morphogenesis protein [Paracoccaceae bacterium]
MADEDRPGYAFAPGPPPDVMEFFRAKGLREGFSWADVEPEEHAYAFTVAKAAQEDVLPLIRREMDRAIAEGRTLAQFQRDLRPLLEEHGWWGRQDVLDMDGPDGPALVSAQLGSPRRLRTIYRANIRSAYAAGQWERAQRTKRALPFFEYRLGPSERHRPHHVALEGTVLPVDDPFWDQHFPPNGWGCKCWLRQITRRRAEELGVSESPRVDTREWTNPRTGRTRDVPVGVDPAWASNPGRERGRAIDAALTGRLMEMPEARRAAVLRGIATSAPLRRLIGSGHGNVPIGLLPDRVAAAFGIPTIVRATAMTKEHLVDDKRGQNQDRPKLIENLARLDAIERIAVQQTRFGPSFHVFVPPGEDDRRMRMRAIYATLWLVDGQTVLRTIFSPKRGYFDSILTRDGMEELKL